MDMEKVTTEQQLSKWAELIQTRLESGQSIKEFCRTNGVSKATYYYWQKKVNEAHGKRMKINLTLNPI